MRQVRTAEDVRVGDEVVYLVAPGGRPERRKPRRGKVTRVEGNVLYVDFGGGVVIRRRIQTGEVHLPFWVIDDYDRWWHARPGGSGPGAPLSASGHVRIQTADLLRDPVGVALRLLETAYWLQRRPPRGERLAPPPRAYMSWIRTPVTLGSRGVKPVWSGKVRAPAGLRRSVLRKGRLVDPDPYAASPLETEG